MRLQERLLRRVQIGPVECRPARHRPHREHLHAGPLTAEIGPGLVPVHLRLVAQHVALRHERLALDQAQFTPAVPNVVAHRRLSHSGIRELRQDATVDAPCRVTLLARRPPILVQHLVNERRDPIQLGFDPRG